MRRFAFHLIAFAVLGLIFLVAGLVVPAVWVAWSVPWLLVWVGWATLVVPVLFSQWARYEERRELALLDEALMASRAGGADALPKLAHAIRAVVEREDVERMPLLLEALVPPTGEPLAREFHRHATAWLELRGASTAAWAGSVEVLEEYDALRSCADRLARHLLAPRH
jgi:hypothetical protein